MISVKLSRISVSLLPLATVLAAVAPAAQALPKIALRPVTFLEEPGGNLRVAIELPCGGHYFGLVAVERGNALQIAAAVTKENITCASVSRTSVFTVRGITRSPGQKLTPLVVNEAKRFKLTAIDDLKWVHNPTSQRSAPRLTAVYAPGCGTAVGTLVRPVGSKLGLAFVERIVSARVACRGLPKERRLNFIAPATPVLALADQPANLARTFTLTLAKIDADSVAKGTEEGATGLSFRYERPCNGAPVGVILGSPRTVGQRTVVAVGMLVARYDNLHLPCPDSATDAQVAVTTFTETELALPHRFDLEILGPSGEINESFDLKLPATIATVPLKRGEPPQVSIAHLSACPGADYGVWTRDGNGFLAVGIAVRQNAKACKPPMSPFASPLGSKVSLMQPYLRGHAAVAAAVRPLTLRSNVAH